MSEVDVQALHANISELKTMVSGLTTAVTDLRVLVASEYIKKAEIDKCQDVSEDRVVRIYKKIDGIKEDFGAKLEAHKKEESDNRWKLAGLTATAVTIFITLSRWLYDLFRAKG